MIKLLVYQRAKSEKDVGPLMEVLREFRNDAMKQPGYITGETLVDTEDPCNVLVISTWHSIDQLNAWNKSETFAKSTKLIDPLLSEPHTERVYGYYLVREGKVWSTV